MRDARAYVAGFGSSGSLLAGAAVLFLIGSAIVAFNGWPQIGAGPATSNISAAPLAASTRASRKLALVIAATNPRAVTHAGGAGAAGHHPVTRRTAVEGVGTGSVQTGSTGSAQPTSAGGATGASPAASAAGQCTSCAGQKPAQRFVSTSSGKVLKTVSGVGGDVVKTVSTAGSAVGQGITGLTGSVGQQVGAVSQPAGSVVSSAGSTVGNTVAGTVSTATNAVNSLTGGLGLGGR